MIMNKFLVLTVFGLVLCGGMVFAQVDESVGFEGTVEFGGLTFNPTSLQFSTLSPGGYSSPLPVAFGLTQSGWSIQGVKASFESDPAPIGAWSEENSLEFKITGSSDDFRTATDMDTYLGTTPLVLMTDGSTSMDVRVNVPTDASGAFEGQITYTVMPYTE